MLYNRYGYALLGLVLIECFQRKEGEERDAGEMLGGISTGAIVAIALFLKASYFVISLPLIAASFFFRKPSFKRILGLALGFCIVLFAMLAYLRFDIRTVVEAFWMAAGARSKAVYLSILDFQLISQMPFLLAAIAILIFGTRHTNPVGSWLDNHQWLIWTLLVFVSDSLLMFSNLQLIAMPLLGVFAILIANRVTAERQRLPAMEARTELPRHVFLLALCALLVVPQLASDLVGLANGVFQKAHPSATIGQVRFTEPHLAPLILYDGDPHKEANGSVYTNYVNDGVTLLRKHCNASDRVLTMDMVNPFPYALKWRPPKGGIAAIAFNYTLSAQFRPSFDAYFGDATVVLLPKHPAQMRCLSTDSTHFIPPHYLSGINSMQNLTGSGFISENKLSSRPANRSVYCMVWRSQTYSMGRQEMSVQLLDNVHALVLHGDPLSRYPRRFIMQAGPPEGQGPAPDARPSRFSRALPPGSF